ncbi:prolipoprotein diacylglyceryl transferase [Rubrobacter calidifluminis]|uniref:prolipoprotein diacylglyceryl transferase n=1 Tax=Rubrobacter calidifluminis TaxID=1392640 RepID=UPI0023609F8C|nr:prolipoprotein diacylglyceryl transferase [Rubrobacter calidifluminis]
MERGDPATMTPAALLSFPSPPSPVFHIGPLTLHYYGLFIAVGVAVATWLGGKELERRGYPRETALDALLYVIIPGLVGARLYHVVTDYELYRGHPFPGVFEIWDGGLGIYGAVAGGLVGLAFFCWRRKIDLLRFMDAGAPGLAFAQSIGRWGNYFNQELFGHPSNLPWAIRIDPQYRPPQYAHYTSFQPTFFYESVWDFFVGFALLWVARRSGWNLKRGDIFFLWVVLYSFGRFFTTMMRVDTEFPIIGGISGNLLVSAALVIGFSLVVFLRHSAGGGKESDRSG